MWSVCVRIIIIYTALYTAVNGTCCKGAKHCDSKDTLLSCESSGCRWTCIFQKPQESESFNYHQELKLKQELSEAQTKLAAKEAHIAKETQKKYEQFKKRSKMKFKSKGGEIAIPGKTVYNPTIKTTSSFKTVPKLTDAATAIQHMGLITFDKNSDKITKLKFHESVVEYFKSKPKISPIGVSFKIPQTVLDHLKSTLSSGKHSKLIATERSPKIEVKRRRLVMNELAGGTSENPPFSHVGQLRHDTYILYPCTDEKNAEWVNLDSIIAFVLQDYNLAHAEAHATNGHQLQQHVANGLLSDHTKQQIEFTYGVKPGEIVNAVGTGFERPFNNPPGSYEAANCVGTIIVEQQVRGVLKTYYYYVLTAAHCIWNHENVPDRVRRNRRHRFSHINSDDLGEHPADTQLKPQQFEKAWVPYYYQRENPPEFGTDWGIMRFKISPQIGIAQVQQHPGLSVYVNEDSPVKNGFIITYEYSKPRYNRMLAKREDYTRATYMLWHLDNSAADHKNGMSGSCIFGPSGSIIGVYNGHRGDIGWAARITEEKEWAIHKILSHDWDIIADVTTAHMAHIQYPNNLMFYNDNDYDGYYVSRFGYSGYDHIGGISKANKIDANDYYYDYDYDYDYDYGDGGNFVGDNDADYYYEDVGGLDYFYQFGKRNRNLYGYRRKLQDFKGSTFGSLSAILLVLFVFVMAVICIFGAVFYRYGLKNSKMNNEYKMKSIQAVK